MDEILTNPHYEFMRPVVTGWLKKLEAAHSSRKKWKELADECMMFYSKSAAAMWDPQYSKKFWKGVKAPRFRITINKAFEFVAVFGPNLMWEVPHRTVEPKRKIVPPELIPQDPMFQQMYQQLQPMQQQFEQQHAITAHLMQEWLNYTPREQPGGGLQGHSELALVDAMIKGRGVLAIRPYQFSGSGRMLTGAFREDPDNLLIDPDFKSLADAKWIAIKHIDPYYEVERKFQLPNNSLKNKASLESAWHFGEIETADGGRAMHRAKGLTNDLVVWYEVYSKTGAGARMTGMEEPVKEHLERVAGDYAYLAICANVPYPLNCPAEAFRSGGPDGRGATDEEIREKFSWPVPIWADDDWPIKCLDFYPDTESAWPIPPLAPAMGELKFLNFLIPWLANRIYSSSRDFWAVAGPHVEHYKKYLTEGEDQTIIPSPVTVDDVRKAVTILQQPETRLDAWRIVELVSELFDKRTGLTEFAYGRNEGGTQNRTAEETQAKARAVGVRPEHMQKKVVAWQSEVATTEAFVTRWFVTAEDVQPLLGPAGAFLWQQFIETTDVELVVRQMEYTISAASIRRPNRERDIANFQQVMGMFAPVMQAYGQMTGNYGPFNYMMGKWAEYHDTDLDGAMIPPPEPPPPDPQMEMEMQKAQMELQGKQMDVQLKEMDMQMKGIEIQGKQVEAQAKQVEAQSKAQAAGQQLLLDFEKSNLDLQQDAQEHQQEMQQDAAEHLFEMASDAEKHEQEMQQKRQEGQLKLELARKQAAPKPKPQTSKT